MEKTTKITIKGKEYTLIFNLHALSMLEEETGLKIFQLKEKELEKRLTSFKFLEIFFWCALNTYHPDLKKRDVGIMIEFDRMEEFSNKAMEAFTKSFPEEKGEKNDNKKKLSG